MEQQPAIGNSAPAPSSLDQLLVESLTQAVETFSLDLLLSESMASVQEAKNVKALRQRVASGGLTKAEQADSASILLLWETRRAWVRTHNTLTFERKFCACCNSYFPQFVAYGEQQEHKTLDSIRWVKVEKHTDITLPRKVIYEDSIVPICEECAKADGWDTEDGEEFVAPEVVEQCLAEEPDETELTLKGTESE